MGGILHTLINVQDERIHETGLNRLQLLQRPTNPVSDLLIRRLTLKLLKQSCLSIGNKLELSPRIPRNPIIIPTAIKNPTSNSGRSISFKLVTSGGIKLADRIH